MLFTIKLFEHPLDRAGAPTAGHSDIELVIVFRHSFDSLLDPWYEVVGCDTGASRAILLELPVFEICNRMR